MNTAAASSDAAVSLSTSSGQRKLAWTLGILSVLLLAFSGWLLVAWQLSVSLDTAMYLSGARTLLEGGLIYVDFIDLNPPLAVQLHLPAVQLANYLQIAPMSAFYCLLYLLTFASALTIYRLLSASSGNANKERCHAVFIALTPIWLLFTQDTFNEMGQRSHLFVLAALPYLIVRMRRAQGSPPDLAIALISGLCIGITTCLKPAHYAVILASAEVYLLFRHRAFKTLIAPEIIAAIGVTIAYVVYVLRLPPASHETFFDFLMPLTLESYAVYGQDLAELMLLATGHMGGPLVVVGACFFLTRSGLSERYRDLTDIAALIGITGAVVYLLQFKGWSYHSTPLVIAAYVMLAALLSHSYVAIAKTRLGQFVSALPVLVIVLLFSAGVTAGSLRAVKLGFWLLKSDEAELVLNETTSDQTVLVISSSVDYSYPMLMLTERRPASRYGFMFPVPLLYDNAVADPNSPYGYSLTGERAAQEQRFLAELNQDITARDPALILVEHQTPCVACPPGMNYPDYLAAHSAALPALQNYAPFRAADRVTAYRKTGAPAQQP